MFNLHFNFRDDAVRSSKQASALLLSAFSLLFIVPFASASQVHQDHGSSHSHYEYLSGQNHGQQIAQQNRLQAKAETQELLDSLNAYRSADKADKKSALNQMVSLAKQRKDYLKQLMESDPAAVAGAVLTAAERQQMPEAVSQYLEQKKTLDGELEVFYEDYEDHSKSRLRHILKTANGRVELHMADGAHTKAFQTGAKVKANGWKFTQADESSNSMLLSEDEESLSFLAQGDAATSTSTAAATSTQGEQKTLVMLVNFQDNIQRPWTIEEVRETVFGTVNDFYKENSFNKVWLSGDVHDYNTLPIDSTTCNYTGIATYARQAAEADGVDLSHYNRLIFLFPEMSGCGWTGMGTLGGTQSRAWINGAMTLNTIGHELGHNFGLHHAERLECGTETIGDNCISVTYGDTMDIMGAAGVNGHFGAHNKQLLGWLSPDAGEIITVSEEGSYILEPYESASQSGAKGIRVRRGTDSVTGEPLWYYIEYRQPIGFDDFLSGKTGITDGVVFRLAAESDIHSSQLLDMTPSSYWVDMDDAALAVGSSYTDINAGVTISTEWADSTGASVHVSFSQASCTQSSSTMSVISDQTSGLTAGDTASYRVTVTNNASDGCGTANYDLSASIPNGWFSTNSSLTLAPGASDTAVLSVTSADNAADGTYNLTFAAINSDNSSDSVNIEANYTIQAPAEVCELANPTLSLSANQTGEVAAGTSVSYSATVANNNSSDCEATSFDVVANVPDGWSADSHTLTLVSGQSASVNITVISPDGAEQGVYPVSVYAYNTADIAYSISKQSSYTVAAPEAVCMESAPRLSVSTTSGDVPAGTTVTYNVTVTNQNSTDCEALRFAVAAQAPAGWSSSSTTLLLASGQSSTVQLMVTSDAAATDGAYAIVFHAQSNTESNVVSTAAVNYVIVNPVNSAPVAVNDSIVLAAKDPTLINVLANDSDPEGDALSVSAVTQGSKGTVEITANGHLLYTPAKNFKGSDSFNYTISDGDKTATATVYIGMDSSSVDSSGPGYNKGKGNK